MNYLTFATRLARQTGAIIRQNFALGMKKEWKANDTPVTVTDVAINQLVIIAVQEQYPDHRVLAEEGDGGAIGSQLWRTAPVRRTHPRPYRLQRPAP
jgi:fructose-1,6-bisphosphatase/inositol monophosphatase family enzyme